MRIKILFFSLCLICLTSCGEISLKLLNASSSEVPVVYSSFKPFLLQQYLRLPNAEVSNTFERYGGKVIFAKSAQRMFVGAPTDWHSTYSEVGSVYVYDYDSNTDAWLLSGTIRKAALVHYDKFGSSMVSSADGKTLYVAGEYSDGLQMFKESAVTPGTWQLAQRIAVTGDRGNTLRYFGWAVNLCSDQSTLIFSGPFIDDTVTGQGAVYVFKFNTSNQQFEQHQKIVELDSLNSTKSFAWSITTDRNCENMAAGSFKETIDYANQGRVYLYRLNKNSGFYEKVQVLSTSSTYANLSFGARVQMTQDGKLLAVYAGNIVNTYTQGSMLFYERKVTGEYVYAYTLLAPSEIVNPTGATNWAGDFKFSLDGQYLYVSTLSCYNGSYVEGCVDVLRKNGDSWSLQQRITSDLVRANSFGGSLEISSDGSLLAIGVPEIGVRKSGNGTSYNSSGGTFLYRVTDAPVVDSMSSILPNKFLKDRSADLLFFSDLSATGVPYQKIDISNLIFNSTSFVDVNGWSVLAIPQTGSVLIESNKLQSAFTIGLSYRPQALTNNGIILTTEKLEVKLVGSGQLQIRLFDVASNLTWITDPAIMALNRWNHLLFSISFGGAGDAPKLYLNGDKLFLYNIAAENPDLTTRPSQIYLGDRLVTNTLAGSIKNVMLWSGSLTPVEANRLKAFYKSY